MTRSSRQSSGPNKATSPYMRSMRGEINLVLPIEQVNNKIHQTDSKMLQVRELNDALENQTGMLNKIIKIKMDKQRETKMRLKQEMKMLEIFGILLRSFPLRDKASLRVNREQEGAEAEPIIETRRGKMRVTPG